MLFSKADLPEPSHVAGSSAQKRWAMAIDVKKCWTLEGCTDCIDACHRVHNVPSLPTPKEEIKWLWTAFCVQRIQEAKAEARRLGVPLRDGDVQPVCAQSCPASAIAFGDLNDPASAVRRLMDDPRRFRVLAELNVQPSIGYLRLIRNRREASEGDGRERHG